MDDKLFDIQVDMEKLKALSESFQHVTYLDFTSLDDMQQAELIKNHSSIATYYSVIMDYINKLHEEIKDIVKN